MRKEFIGHFKRSEGDVKRIWKAATFVFDANVLLNLYRYSDATRNDFLNLFERVKDRIWLPEQAGYEFLTNRPRVILEQRKAYADAIESVERLSKSFSEERAHPFISNKIKVEYDKATEAIKAEMRVNQEAQEKLLANDAICEKIADLFEGRVGVAHSAEEMSRMFEDGTKRFAERTPPGYMDENKFKTPKNDAEKRSNFGDWILWKQLMDFGKELKRPVVFVTNDTKEDWWLAQSGMTIGPRPELIAEFFAQTQQHILIYKPERFLDLGKKNLDAVIDEKSIVEVSSERKAREISRLRRLQFEGSTSQKSQDRLMLQLKERDKQRITEWRSALEKERDWKLDLMKEELHELETQFENLDSQIFHFQNSFSEAVEVGDHARASELEGRLHELMLHKEELLPKLFKLRNAYMSERKS